MTAGSPSGVRTSPPRAAAGPGRRPRCSGRNPSEPVRRAVRRVQPPAHPGRARPGRAPARGRRRRTGTAAAPAAEASRSSTCAAVTRASASSSSVATVSSSGLTWRSARSASRTRSRCPGWLRAAPGSVAEAERRRDQRRERLDVRAHDQHVARLSVGSSASSPSTTSRSTSTCRCGPWQACTCTLRSPSSTGRAGGRRPVVAQLALQPARAACAGGSGRRVVPVRGVRRRGGQPRAAARARRGRARTAAGGGPSRRWGRRGAAAPTPAAPAAPRSHSAGDGCGSHRCTSRCSASAASTARWAAGSRVGPNSDSRRVARPGSGRRAARRRPCRSRSAGSGRPTRSRSRRHSSGCQLRSPASPRRRRPTPRSISGRCARSRRTARPVGARWRTGDPGARSAGRRSPRWAPSAAHHGSPAAWSITSSSGQASRDGRQGSSSGSVPAAVATTVVERRRPATGT